MTETSDLPPWNRSQPQISSPSRPVIPREHNLEEGLSCLVVLFAVDNYRRYPIGLLGLRTDVELAAGEGTTNPTSYLMEMLRHSLDEADFLADAEAGQFELHGADWRITLGVSDQGELARLTEAIVKGVHLAYPLWILARVYLEPEASDPANIASIRSFMQRLFSRLDNEEGRWLYIDEIGRLGYYKSGKLSDWAEEEFSKLWRKIRRVVLPSQAGRYTASSLFDETKEVAGTDPELLGQEAMETLVERVDLISDPLARLEALDYISRTFGSIVLNRMFETATEFRETGGTWREIGETLGVTAQSVQGRIDPVARQRNVEKARRLRARLNRMGEE